MTREEAIQELKEINTALESWSGFTKYPHALYIAIDMAIEALQADWIPITELEPNTSNHVLVTYKWGEDDYEVSELDYWVTKYEAENGNAQCKRLIDHVIAWRYMLAPYRGGDAE